MCLQIHQCQIGHGTPGFHGAAGHVGGEDDIVQSPQLWHHPGLVDVDIQARTGDGFGFEGLDQGGLIDHRTTGHVDQETFGAQGGQHLGIDQSTRAIAPRGDGHQKIHLSRQGLGTGVIGEWQIGAFVARCVGNAHVKSGCAFGNRLPNSANAHQTQSSTRQLASQWKGPVHPITSAHKLMCLRNATRHRQHQTQCQISHIVIENPGRVADADAALLDGGDVDAVITHAKNRDHFHSRKQAEQFFVNFGLAPTHDGPNPAQGPWVGDVLMVVDLEMVL